MVELPIDSAEHFARHLVTNFRSQGESLVIAPGGGFYVDNKRGRSQIRLAAVLEPQKIKRSAEILGEALASYQTL